MARLGATALNWSVRVREDIDNSYDRDGYEIDRERWVTYMIVAAFFAVEQEIASLNLRSFEADQLKIAIRDELAIWDEDAWEIYDDCAGNYRSKRAFINDRTDHGDVLAMWVLVRMSPVIPTPPEGLRLPRVLGRCFAGFGGTFWQAVDTE